MKLKHFSNKELLERKDELRIIIQFYEKNNRFYDIYRIRNEKRKIIGYITRKQYLKIIGKVTKISYDYIIYKIK